MRPLSIAVQLRLRRSEEGRGVLAGGHRRVAVASQPRVDGHLASRDLRPTFPARATAEV